MKYLPPLLFLAIMGAVGGLGYLRLKEPKAWNLILALLTAPENPPTLSSPTSPPTFSSAPPKVFIPPDPLPAQPNWTWTVVGKDYHNVIVTKVEADCAHITYDGGIGAINIADLSPEIQKLLNYDPQLAAATARQKADARAQVEAAEAPKIAAMQQEEEARAAAAEAERKAGVQSEKAAVNVEVAQDQKRQIEEDIRQMEEAHEVGLDPISGQLVGTN